MKEIKEIISENEKLKRINDVIEIGNKWYEQKIKEGWQETELGFMSSRQIEESGMIKDSSGKWSIPTLEYIAEKKEDGRNKGEKYLGIAPKFLLWYKKLMNRLTIDDQINNEIEKETKHKTKPYDDYEGKEFDIDEIPF